MWFHQIIFAPDSNWKISIGNEIAETARFGVEQQYSEELFYMTMATLK